MHFDYNFAKILLKMDFSIYEKIFKEKNDIQKHKILKSIAYLKIKESAQSFSFQNFVEQINETISKLHNSDFKDEKFLFILLLIHQILKEKLGKENNEELYKLLSSVNIAFDFFIIHCSDQNAIIYEIKKTLVKILCFFPENVLKLFDYSYNIKYIFQKFFNEDASGESTLEKRITHFQVFLSLAKDFIIFIVSKKKEINDFEKVFINYFVNTISFKDFRFHLQEPDFNSTLE